MSEFEATLQLIGRVAIGIIVMLFLARILWVLRTRRERGGIGAATPWAKVMGAFRILVLAAVAYGALHYLFVLQRGSAFMPENIKAVLASVLLGYLVFEMVIAWFAQAREPGWVATSFGLFASLGLAIVGGLLIVLWIRASSYPVSASTALALPFAGEWVAIGAGPTGITNHHDRVRSLKYALDIVRTCADGRVFRGEGLTNAESCTFGAPVLAPAAGVVVHVVDGLPDQRSKTQLAGNHVVIRLDADHYVALAHFKNGSVRVKVGDVVEPGQVIGAAGNSGNSDFSHLHVHVQDTPRYEPSTTVTYPFHFENLLRKRFLWWEQLDEGFLLSNDHVRPIK